MIFEDPLPGAMDVDPVQTGASLTFGLLGKILFNYPDRSWLQPLLDRDVFAESPFGPEQPEVVAGLGLMRRWGADNGGIVTDSALEDLRADFTRLFIGPDRVLAPPWESVHRSVDRLLFQEQTLQVRSWYRRYGLEAAKLYREPEDHVGLELAFLSHLADLAAEAAAKRDEVTLSDMLNAERQFLSEHPITWVPMWCEMVACHAQTDFYRGIARLARGAISEFARMLGVTVPRWGLAQP